MRMVLVGLVVVVVLVLLTVVPAEMADRRQATAMLHYFGPYGPPGRPRGVEVDAGRHGIELQIPVNPPGGPPGLVVPQTEDRVYLMLLAVFVFLLLVPSGIRRLYRFYGGT
jgi:hypothetical protein